MTKNLLHMKTRAGTKRKCYTIFYRYAVVLKFNKFKEKGDKTPTDSTANALGINKSSVSRWVNKSSVSKWVRSRWGSRSLLCQSGSDQTRHGQPRLEICFRGQGKHITEEEKSGWHPDVSVRLHPSVWYDRPTFVPWEEEHLPEITAVTRQKKMETVLFVDNLDSYTTDTFMKILRQNDTKRQLDVTNVTDITQLVDMGLGRVLKVRIGLPKTSG